MPNTFRDSPKAKEDGRYPATWPLIAATFERYQIEARDAGRQTKLLVIAIGPQSLSARSEALRIPNKMASFRYRASVFPQRNEGREGRQIKWPAIGVMDGRRQLQWPETTMGSTPEGRYLGGPEKKSLMATGSECSPKETDARGGTNSDGQ